VDVEERIAGPGLELRVSIVPWDSHALGFPVAEIDAIELTHGEDPATTLDLLVSWLDQRRVRLVSARLESLRLRESMLLEDLGFRFVEMVYSPVREPLSAEGPADEGVVIAPATEDDLGALRAMASSVFTTGRHVLDPRLDARAGHERYRNWLEGAFADERQQVLKATIRDEISGFFVIEEAPDDGVYWHLTAMAREAQGRGLGKKVWRSMIARHRADGIRRITTTISAHNTPVINLYADLGFRFTAPRSTFHWVR
jgi:RimJ/RimL family protein N-acetyltransferase